MTAGDPGFDVPAGPVRAHRPDVLTSIARLHARTPIDALTAAGVQARAWSIVSQLPQVLPAGASDARGGSDRVGIAAVIGFYAALFDLDPVQVTHDVNAANGLPSSFRCPVCAAVSHNPRDLAEGYCGYCHAFTGTPQPLRE